VTRDRDAALRRREAAEAEGQQPGRAKTRHRPKPFFYSVPYLLGVLTVLVILSVIVGVFAYVQH
jgi:hypothetical protein